MVPGCRLYVAALVATGCSLTTSFEGLSGGPGPASEAADASMDAIEPSIDVPQAFDTPPATDLAVEESEDSSLPADAWADGDDVSRDGDASQRADALQQADACTPDRCSGPSCANGIEDGRETAIDCGGGCAPCRTGQTCLVASDCQSKVCSLASPPPDDATVADVLTSDAAEGGPPRDADSEPYKICQAATCLDRVLNGEEADVDCGGTCPQCPPGASCRSWADCLSKVCTSNRCSAPTCNDGVVNGSETAVDCGGSCAGCPPGERCALSSDCNSGVCKAQICSPPTCLDGTKNGAESDVDCGGGTCPLCLAGRRCNGAADCASGICRGGTCRAS
jgi:hypothetical protein